MKVAYLFILVVFLNSIPSAFAEENSSAGVGWTYSYDWFNQIVNQTPTKKNHCPTLSVDNEKNGYRLALRTSFYGSVMPSISKWYPNEEIWASISVGPMVNKFGITFSSLSDIMKIESAYERNLPTTARELEKWMPQDAAYWESQGGVAFYVGAGHEHVHAGLFAVASGGWVNYLEKIGPQTVYVERAHKQINSMAISGGVGAISTGLEDIIESAKGFNYEFNLDSSENIEAFERFMAGDATLAYSLSQIPDSGVKKTSDTSMNRFGRYFGMSITTPFIPVISLRASQGRDVNFEEEHTIWDEHIVKNYGVYIRQNRQRLFGMQNQEAISFKGGKTTIETPGSPARTEKYYGNFKFAYQADWGQEMMLSSKIKYAQEIAGLDENGETCVKIPSVSQTLGYNQVFLHLNLSDEYMRMLLGKGQIGENFLKLIENRAKFYDSSFRGQWGCHNNSEGGTPSGIVCQAPTVESIFDDLRKYTRRIRLMNGNEKANFSLNMANIGKAIWSNPAVFKAFFEKGKSCGSEFKFEVSGLRISRFLHEKKYAYNSTCLSK